MTAAINTLINQLQTILAEKDQQVTESVIEWFKGRYVALKEAKEKYADLSNNAWAYYPKLFDVCGGKGNYMLIQYGVGPSVIETIRKSEQTKIAKRNAKIAKKLSELNVLSVESEEKIWTQDGFQGVFRLNTDQGLKVVVIDVIYAGGHSVQCLHTRTLVKVR